MESPRPEQVHAAHQSAVEASNEQANRIAALQRTQRLMLLQTEQQQQQAADKLAYALESTANDSQFEN